MEEVEEVEEEQMEEEGGISLEEASVQNTRRVTPRARRVVEERMGDPAGDRRVEVIFDLHCLHCLHSPRGWRVVNGQKHTIGDSI